MKWHIDPAIFAPSIFMSLKSKFEKGYLAYDNIVIEFVAAIANAEFEFDFLDLSTSKINLDFILGYF